jgi:hypothetical protein
LLPQMQAASEARGSSETRPASDARPAYSRAGGRGY